MKLIEMNSIDEIVDLCKNMDETTYITIRDRLIHELNYTENKAFRNTIAIVLSDLKCDEAIETIINLINIPQNKNCIGTLIYALQELNCEHEIKNIMHVLFVGNLEAKCNMYNLLQYKVESMSQEDKNICKNILREEKSKLEEKLIFVEDVEKSIFMNV